MKLIVSISIIVAFLIANESKMLIDNQSIQNQECKDESCLNLKSKFDLMSKFIKSDLNTTDSSSVIRADYTGSIVSQLKGTWNITYTNGSKSYSTIFYLNTIESDSSSDHMITGKTSNGYSVGCFDITDIYIVGSYQFACFSLTYSTNYSNWFFINLSNDDISGRYEYNTDIGARDVAESGKYDGYVSGYRNSSSSDTSTKYLTKNYIDSLGVGWNLIGSSDALNDMSIFNSATDIYVYKNGNWQTKSNTTSINEFSGIWIYKENRAISTYSSNNTKSDKNLNKDYIQKLETGWTLVGSTNNITDMSIFNSATDIFVYKNGNWQTKSNTTSIDEFSGIWIYK